MRIGVIVEALSVDCLIGRTRLIRDAGIRSVWTYQVFGMDAITSLTLLAREVPDVEVATGVVPTWLRHPMVMGAQALTAQQATGGRFRLGIGLSHKVLIEDMMGISWSYQIRHMREYLSVLVPLVNGESVAFDGEVITMHGGLDIPDADPVPVFVAALGPKMLNLAGELADGTVTWMTGPRTLASHTIPTIRAAAAAAGRDVPKVVAALPVCVTDDVASARAEAVDSFGFYGMLPSYRAMLEREGARGPADVAVVGDEAHVRGVIEQLFEDGVTEVVAAPFSNRERTIELLAGLVDPVPDIGVDVGS